MSRFDGKPVVNIIAELKLTGGGEGKGWMMCRILATTTLFVKSRKRDLTEEMTSQKFPVVGNATDRDELSSRRNVFRTERLR